MHYWHTFASTTVATLSAVMSEISWTIIASLGAAVAALAAIATAMVMVWQTRYTTKTQVLLQLTTTWESAPLFTGVRKKAAHTLLDALNKAKIHHAIALKAKRTGLQLELGLSQQSTPHLDQVLDFFETVALFERKHMLDFDLVYQIFWWPLSCYWVLTEKYVLFTQREYGNEVWENYRNLALRFIKRDGEGVAYEQVEEFLNDELAL